MPDPPAVNQLTRVLFENPYPLGGILLAAAAVLAWSGLRNGQAPRLAAAGVAAGLGSLVLIVAAMIVTPAEHGRRVTREFVDAVVAGDRTRALATIADDGGLSFVSVRNVALGKDYIAAQLDRTVDRYAISSNRISMLKSYTTDEDEAVVHLACWTEAEAGYGPTVTQWVLTVRLQEDDTWKIHRLTWVSVAGRSAQRSYLP